MKKILVANRGEIALRIMKSIQKMGIKTVAIFSEADRNAPHVKFADEAVCVGPAPSNQSYLLGNKIIEVCKQLNVDGIHPGYGFLSENADFAEAVEEAGISFIGPRSKAIRIMGSKLAAKDAVKKYDIPMVPGIDEAITDTKKAKKIAAEIGYPILIKASAGGGGKGMRVVEQEKDLEDQMKRAISEAKSAFGDGSVFIEKYVASPRHIEIQVLADKYKVDLAKVAIQFSYAPKVVDTVLVGASKPYQPIENEKALNVKIPKDFWVDLKSEGLIDERCETPQF